MVQDPRNPKRALSAGEFERPTGKTVDGGILLTAIGVAVLCRVLVLVVR
ncbi:hypothetical protein [Streptomyces sp. NPDC048338]